MATVVRVPSARRGFLAGAGIGRSVNEEFQKRDKEKKAQMMMDLLSEVGSGAKTVEDMMQAGAAAGVFTSSQDFLSAYKMGTELQMHRETLATRKSEGEKDRESAERRTDVSAGASVTSSRISAGARAAAAKTAANSRREAAGISGAARIGAAEVAGGSREESARITAGSRVESSQILADARVASANIRGSSTPAGEVAVQDQLSEWGVENTPKNRAAARRVMSNGVQNRVDDKLTKLFSDKFGVDFASLSDEAKLRYRDAQDLALYHMSPQGGGESEGKAVTMAFDEAIAANPPEELPPPPPKESDGGGLVDMMRGAFGGFNNDVTSGGTEGSNASPTKTAQIEYKGATIQIPADLVESSGENDEALLELVDYLKAKGITNEDDIYNIIGGLDD